MLYLSIEYPTKDHPNHPEPAKYRAILFTAPRDAMIRIKNIAEGDDIRDVVWHCTNSETGPIALKMPDGDFDYPDCISIAEAAEAVYLKVEN